MARFIHNRSVYITSHVKRIEKYECPKKVNVWIKRFHLLNADKITWNFPWFPWEEVIYVLIFRPFFLLIGIRGVQPYVPLRVLRQLGRRQIVPITEDMKIFVFEVGPGIPLLEGFVQKIWDGYLVMEFETMVEESDIGEAHLGIGIL